ncbi:MAG: hypothetical protein HYZ75_09180 [Elusimicrobia bacterium]|nr:hypothetical protein [Elusimicrobiota bacterium]
MTAGLLASLLALPALAWTWAPAPESSVIGSPIRLAAQVDALPGSMSLAEGQTHAPFELLGAEIGGDGTAVITVMAFGLGRQSLPPLRWLAGGKELRSPPLQFTLIPPPPGPSDTGDIREIRGPYAARMGVWWGLLAALAAGAAYLAWRLTRKKPEPAASGPAAPPDLRSPEQRALDALEGLDGIGLPVKEFYDRVSDIIRLYLHERHGVDALRMTTYDLQRAMIREGFPPPARQSAKALFDRCDLAKFARMKPTDSEGRRDLESAKTIIKLLAPATGVEGDLAGLPEAGR